MDINEDKLRKDLIDYYGTAMSNGFPMAVIDLGKAERATQEELLKMARDENFDLNKYTF